MAGDIRETRSRLGTIALAGSALILLGAAVVAWRSGSVEALALSRMTDAELRAAAERPGAGKAHRFWADRLLARGETAAAAESYHRAADAEPGDERAWIGWGRSTLALGRPQLAREILEKTVEQWPGRAETRFSLAAAYAMLGDSASAARHLRQGLELKPRNRDAWRTLGQTLESLGPGEQAAAAEAYGRAAALAPDDLEAHIGRARCLVRLRRGPEAEVSARAALRLDPSHLEARMTLAEALLLDASEKRRDEGMKELGRASNFHPDQPAPYRRLGEVWLAQGQHADAAQALARAVDLDQTSEETYELLARAHRHLGATTQAKSALARAAEIRRWRHETVSAHAAVQRAGRAIPPRVRYARALLHLRRYDEAEVVYGEILAIQPGHTFAARQIQALRQLKQRRAAH